MRLGQTQTRTFIAGVTNARVIANPVAVVIDNSMGQHGVQPSSARYKRDIQPMGAHSQGLFQLRPVTFCYPEDASGERQYGLIAEEVANVYPELVTRDSGGEVEAVQYHALIPLLLNAVQHQKQAVDVQAWQLVELQTQNAALAARLEGLEAAAARAAAQASR